MGRPMDPESTRPLQATFVLPILERSKIMLRCIKRTTVRLWSDESGASLLEYSVLVGLITAAVVGTITCGNHMDGRPLDHIVGDTYRLAELIAAVTGVPALCARSAVLVRGRRCVD